MDTPDSQNPEADEAKTNSEKMQAALQEEFFGLIAIPIETEESLKKRFGFGNEGVTHKELVDSVNNQKKVRGKYKPRQKLVPKIPLEELAKTQFIKSLEKETISETYPRINKIFDYLSKNEYNVLYFICKNGFNNFTAFPCIEEETWKTGIKNNYDIFTEAPKIPKKSRYNAIENLIAKNLLEKKDFKDRKGIFYFLNTDNSMKIFDLVEQNELNRDDLERLNQLLKRGLLKSLDPELVPKFLHYKGEKISDIKRNIYTSDLKYFHQLNEKNSPCDKAQNKSGKDSQNSLSIDHHISSLLEKIYDPENDLTLRKNPLADFSQKDKIIFLTYKLPEWKMTEDNLDELIGIYTLDEVIKQALITEEVDRTKKKVGNFFRYLETSLENEKLKMERKALKKFKKQMDAKSKSKPKADKEEIDYEKCLSLFQLFNPLVTEHTLKCNFNALLNRFIDTLKDMADGNKPELLETIPKIKEIIEKGEKLESLILLTRTEAEARAITHFLRNY